MAERGDLRLNSNLNVYHRQGDYPSHIIVYYAYTYDSVPVPCGKGRGLYFERMQMLVLNRRQGESICIGDDIVVTLARIGTEGNPHTLIRVGVEAPKEVSIHRQEIYEIIQREKEKKNDTTTD